MSAFFPMPDGCRLHYRLDGTPGQPWLVLLNGLLSDTTSWTGAVNRLRERFRILVFDSRGQGRSDAPDMPYTVAQRAEDARLLMAALGVTRPWLSGLSNGAAVGLELLAAAPGTFAGAVLVSAAPGVDFAMELKLRHWLDCLERGGPRMQFDAVAPFLWGDRFLERRYDVLRSYHATLMAGGGPTEGPDAFRGARNQILGALASGFRTELEAIRDPLLLISGAEDLLTPPWKAMEVAKVIPHARFETVPGIGHAYPVEDPKAFALRLGAFVDETGRDVDRHGLSPWLLP